MMQGKITGRANQSTLVGREYELQQMRAMLHDVHEAARLQTVGSRHISGIPLDTQRQPQFLLLNGAAGIGKTRLAEEVGREAQHDGWTVVWSRNTSRRAVFHTVSGSMPCANSLLWRAILTCFRN